LPNTMMLPQIKHPRLQQNKGRSAGERSSMQRMLPCLEGRVPRLADCLWDGCAYLHMCSDNDTHELEHPPSQKHATYAAVGRRSYMSQSHTFFLSEAFFTNCAEHNRPTAPCTCRQQTMPYHDRMVRCKRE
jgi:hypothetical protein